MLPLVSSEKVLAALLRLGCYLPRRPNASHQPICRDLPSGRKFQVLVLGRHEVKRGTLKAILDGLEITEGEFIE